MNFKNYIVSATTAALIATSVLSVSSFTANATTTAPTTTTTTTASAGVVKSFVPFSVYKAADLKEVSSMARSMVTVAEVETTVDGKIYAYATINSASVWKSFKTEVNGEMKEVETVSEDKTANTKLVKFEISDLTKAIESDIEIQAGPTLMPHKTFIKFNTEATSEQSLQVWDKEKVAISQGVTRSIDSKIQIVKEGDKQFAYLKLLTATYWQGLKTEVNGEMVEAKVVSEDAATNTKIVKFEVPSRDVLIEMASHIVVKMPAGGVHESIYKTYLDLNNVLEKEKETKPEVVAPVNPNKVVSTTKYNYSLVTSSKKAKSAANGYMVKPLTVTKTQDGKYYATVKLKNAGMYKSMKTEVNGKMVSVKTVAVDKAKKTKTVKFQVKSPTATVKTTFTLNTKSKKLAGKYTNYFKVGTKYVKAASVTSTKKYNFTVLKEDKSGTSATSSYLANPATVEKMSDGKFYATVTLKSASVWQSLKTEVNGKMVEVKTVSTNKAKDTKVVKFQVPSASAQVKASLHIKFSGYDNKYTNFIKLGKEVKK